MKLFIPCFGKSASMFPGKSTVFIVEINSKFYVLFFCLLLFILSPFFYYLGRKNFSSYTISLRTHPGKDTKTILIWPILQQTVCKMREQITGNTMIQCNWNYILSVCLFVLSCLFYYKNSTPLKTIQMNDSNKQANKQKVMSECVKLNNKLKQFKIVVSLASVNL